MAEALAAPLSAPGELAEAWRGLGLREVVQEMRPRVQHVDRTVPETHLSERVVEVTRREEAAVVKERMTPTTRECVRCCPVLSGREGSWRENQHALRVSVTCCALGCEHVTRNPFNPQPEFG